MSKNAQTISDIPQKKKHFTANLLKWNKLKNKRQMPWKGEKDPYKIWLSEIILQQTRVEQGLKYYNNFINTFPDIHKLAKALDNKVFKLWEGLGYYTRCRNLIDTARFISLKLNGKFPDTYEEIIALKGIGPYTAAAISSFAFNLPYAVVDGNVFRVLSRVFGISKPIDSTEGKKIFTQLANELLNKKQAGHFNQAIMDFGATICKPALPLCSACPINKNCYALLNNKVNELPVKEKKIIIKRRYFNYFVLNYKNETAILQRTQKDIWRGLYEFPLIESKKIGSKKNSLLLALNKKWVLKDEFEVMSVSPAIKQQLSHQLITGKFFIIKLNKKPAIKNCKWVKENNLKRLAFPQLINSFIGTQKK